MARPRLTGLLPAVLLGLSPFGALAQDSTVVLFESFNTAAVAALPPGWTSTGESLWMTDDGAPAGTDGLLNLKHQGTKPGRVLTPALDLSVLTSGTLSYLARRSGSYDQGSLVVRASTDGGVSFPHTLIPAGTALPLETSEYVRMAVPLSPDLLGQQQVVIAFEAAGGSYSTATVRLDDVAVAGILGAVRVTPDRLTFATEAGTVQERTLIVENGFSRSMQIEAPVLTGSAFSITPSAGAVLDPGGTLSYTVAFAPPVPDAYSGSISFRHDMGEQVVPLLGSVGTNAFGFATSFGEAIERSDTISIPISLSYRNATALHGLDFSVSWDTSAVTLLDVARGSAISGEAAWSLSWQGQPNTVRVLLLGGGTTGLPAGDYQPLLILRVSASALINPGSLPITFTITQAIGALATTTGDDAAITVAGGSYSLTLRKRDVQFSLIPETLDLGTLDVGQSRTAKVTAYNSGTAGALTISQAASSNPAFTVSPANVTIAAGEQAEFAVTFAPTAVRFGAQSGTLTFTHDGPGGAASVDFRGRGNGGRGDGSWDGMVELMDVVHLVDAALGRTAPDGLQRAAVDLYPFSSGDGALDVRDATVLSHGIVNGRWPDGHSLPPEVSSSPPASKGALAHAGQDTVYLMSSEDGTMLFVRHAVPLRGLQLVLRSESAGDVEPASMPGATLMLRPGLETGTVRLMLFRVDGGTIPAGHYTLATTRHTGLFDTAEVAYATAVDTLRIRLPVQNRSFSPADTTGAPKPPTAFTLGAPYPNPFSRAARAMLRIPVGLPEAGRVQITVYDLLGRAVAVLHEGERAAGEFAAVWDGRDARGVPAPPGLYFVRAGVGSASRTVPVMLVR